MLHDRDGRDRDMDIKDVRVWVLRLLISDLVKSRKWVLLERVVGMLGILR